MGFKVEATVKQFATWQVYAASSQGAPQNPEDDGNDNANNTLIIMAMIALAGTRKVMIIH